MTSGLFIAVEGPNGAGKTTTVLALAEHLRSTRRYVHVTTEPSGMPLGRLIRSTEADLTGRALALAVAADRYAHLDTEIMPALARGEIVVSDRYVQSSLVLQRLDGLGTDEIWQYNAHVPDPHLSFYLRHNPEVLRQRLHRRPARSRLESLGSPEQETMLYQEAFEFLAGHGWRQAWIDCHGLDVDAVTARLYEHVVQLIARQQGGQACSQQ